MSSTYILGIETTCDETAAAVVKDGVEVLSNVIATQHHLHEKFGGVVPEVASRAQLERMLPVIEEALRLAEVKLEDVDAIAVSNRPGLIGSILVGLAGAKGLAWATGKPLIGVDHIKAHLYAGALDVGAMEYPAIGLVVSGGHSNLYSMSSPMEMNLLGATIDDAVGEAYDKVAKIMDLGYPGGPILDKLAQQGEATVKFPRSLLGKESLDFSFSGLKTSVLYHVCGQPSGRGKNRTFEKDASSLSDEDKKNISASFQAAVADVISEKLKRGLQAMVNCGQAPKTLVIGGGVSANSEVRKRCLAFGEEHGLDVRLPKMGYCLDNAAMIAGYAQVSFDAGLFDDLSLEAVATTGV